MLNKSFIYLFIALFVLTSCQNTSTSKTPSHTESEESTSEILTTTHMITEDAMVSLGAPSGKYGNSPNLVLYNVVKNKKLVNRNLILLKFDSNDSFFKKEGHRYLLRLFYDKSSNYGNENSAQPIIHINRITSEWSQSNVTWLNKPTIDVNNTLTVIEDEHFSNTGVQLDITSIIKDITDDNNYGIQLSFPDEQLYGKIIFVSKEHSNTTLHSLIVKQ